MNEMYERTIGLIGEDKFASIQNKTILVVGLGGVGGTALEALARSGFQHFVIVDYDKVSLNNLNRQILYTSNDVDTYKVDAAKNRLLSINSSLDISVLNTKLNEENIKEFDKYQIDFIVDAIDDVKGKIALAKYSFDKNVPLIMSLGMANRLDPNKVQVMRLDKTTNDPLAKKMRHELKASGVDTTKITAVCSSEAPIKDCGFLHSMMMVPSSAGLNIAQYVLSCLSK